MDNSKIYIYGKEVVTPYYLNEAVADKATKAYVDESIANIEAGDVDLTNYYTKEETEAYVTEAIADVEAGDINLTNYYTKNEVDEKIEETEKWLAGKRFHFADSMDSIDNIQALVLEAKEVGWENIVLVVCGGFIESLHGLYTVTDTVLITTGEGKNSGDITFTMLHPGKGSFNTEYAVFNDKGYNETTVTEQTIILTIENDMLAGMDYPTTNEKLIAHYLPTNATSDTPAYMPTVAANPASKGYVDSLNPIIFLDGTTETTLAVDIREKIFPMLKDETVVRYPMFYVYPNDSEFNVGVTKIENVADDHFVLKSIDENMRVERAASNSWIIPSTAYLWVDHDYTNVRDIRKQTGQNGGPALVLETGTQYTEPYEPQYDGSPATKKYVDDAVSSMSGGGSGGGVYYHDNASGEPTYINTLEEGTHIFRSKGLYLIASEELYNASGSTSYTPLLDGTVYVTEKYDNVADGEYFSYLVVENGGLRGLTKDLSKTTGFKLNSLHDSYIDFLRANADKVINSIFTFNNLPKCSKVPTDDKHFANKKYVDDSITTAVGNIASFSLMPVTALPTENIQTNVIYLLPSENPEEENIKVEYVYINGAWEKIGTTEIDLSNYYTKTEVNTRINNAVSVLPTKDYVDGKVETAIQGLTGEELDSSLNNGQLSVGDSITCTQDYLGKYEQGNIYLVQEKERGEVSIVQQLQDLGFNVSISSRLLSNDIKYFYIVEYGDEGDMYCAYSKVPLNVSGSKFPSDGWKTFSVRKMNDSDPNFYYAKYDTNKNLSSMTELTSSTNDGKYWASQFSSDVVATYTNDPAAASLYTPYVVDPTELVKYTVNITPKTDLSNYMLKTEVEANYYSKEEIDAKFAEIMTILPVASQEEVQEILDGEVSE